MLGILFKMRDRFISPKYAFRDRLYFLFGTAGLISAAAAFFAAIFTDLPSSAAIASAISFFVMLVLMVVSFFIEDVTVCRIFCALFLNFFMFPVLFWVTGGVNCGMVFYFLLGLSVAALVLSGKLRTTVLVAAIICDAACIHLGFMYPGLATELSYEERMMDTSSSFVIVAVFIVAVIIMMSSEYQREHDKVIAHSEKLERQANTDNLTDLYNQRYLLRKLDAVVAAYNEKELSASIVMFDIDDFKMINDRYGHLCGDQVLFQFGCVLKLTCGEHNFAARYGGEEFIVVLPRGDEEQAFNLAEAIRMSVLSDPVLHGLTRGKFSISGGVAQLGSGMAVPDWINLADTRLYQAKKLGKNKIIRDEIAVKQ